MDIGIIGGGLSGVSLQYYLNHNSVIMEKESNIGGLCSTYNKNGFYYDIGGHALFSKNITTLNIIDSILKDNVHFCKRINSILYKDLYVKYPFENGLGLLDKKEAYECVIDFLNNTLSSYSNFEEWVYFTFGKTISDSYLIPYNNKIWKTNLKNMSTDWVDRIPKPPFEDILKSAMGIETEGYIHQLNFKYPIHGGIKSLVNSFINSKSNILTNCNISKIEKKNKWIVHNNGNKLFFDKLIITAPLKEIIKLISDVPDTILNYALSLKHNAIKIIMLGINNESLLEKSCIFIPDKKIIPHRICFMGYFSKNNVPKNTSSLIAEITCSTGSDLYNIDNDNLIDIVSNQLHEKKIINKNNIICSDIIAHNYGYVIPTIEDVKKVKIIKEYAKSIGLDLLGRFGENEYINMDKAIENSYLLACRLNLETS